MSPFRSNASRLLVTLAVLVVLGATGALVLSWLIRMDALLYLARLNQWLADTFIRRMGYAGVFALMCIESSLVPFPSEIVIPPAGDLARRLPDWSLTAVVLWGTAGSLAGALFNYYVARYLGRRLLVRAIARFGRYLRVTQHGYEQAEAMFYRHGAISTLTGRLIPGIRQIISLPAGLAHMNLLSFCLLTALGAGSWTTALALAGYWFGAEPERLNAMLKTYSHWLLGGALALLAVYVLVLRVRRWRAVARGLRADREAP